MVVVPLWKEEGCIRCGACVGSCPEGAMRLKNWGIRIDQKTCIGCGRCILFCPVGSIVEGQ